MSYLLLLINKWCPRSDSNRHIQKILDFESSASTNSTTGALGRNNHVKHIILAHHSAKIMLVKLQFNSKINKITFYFNSLL